MSSKGRQINLVGPERLVVELHQVADPSAPNQLLQLPSRLAIELHDAPDTKPRQTLRAFGRGVWLFVKDVLPPLASVIIAVFVFYYGKQFNDRQAASQEEQTRTQAKQAETAESELELKILSDFTNSIAQLTDESPEKYKVQTVAAIKFIQYGEKALPIIKIALGVEENTVRRGATVVAVQMFQSEKIGRKKLLSELEEYFKTQNPYLRRGVLECFVKLEDQLSNDEAIEVVGLLKNYLNPQSDCSKSEDDNAFFEAAVFLGGQASLDSQDLLLQIAENRSCTRARIQAVDSLPEVVKELRDEQRAKIVARLQLLTSGASNSLLKSIKATIHEIQPNRDISPT
jgi:translation initiation factor 1 (eIF-1/SUI1)